MIYRTNQHKTRKCSIKDDCYGVKWGSHREKCKSIFSHIDSAECLYIKVERNSYERESINRFAEEISLDNFDNKQDIRVSLLTRDIMEYDLEMFSVESKAKLLNEFRPYFISFIVPLEINNIENIESVSEGWYEGRFYRNDSFNLDETDSKQEHVILDGVLEISASPVNYLDGKLIVFTNNKIKKTVLDRINSIYDPKKFKCTDNKTVESFLNNAWMHDIPKTIDFYNVGHGNADYIRGFNRRILYDIGYNYRSFPNRHHSRYLRAVNALRYMKPNCVVLSHWDMDHIIGCAYANQDIFNVKWIAPHLVSSKDKNASINSIRLAHYLDALGNLCLVDRNQNKISIATISCANDIEIKIWLGNGASMITPKNREGLILEIVDKNRNKAHVLLAGDVPYNCIDGSVIQFVDIMHVPHHCSNMELDQLKNLQGKGELAIISTNRNKDGTLNRNSNHYAELNIKFDEVIHTIDNKSGDDEANLSIQVDYISGKYRFR